MSSTDVASPAGPTRPATDTRRFFPQLEGMRAIAALGVLTTHVAFQTRAVQLPVIGPVLGRLDLAVALFFALSGFLLWRSWVSHAHDDAPRPSVRRYLRHRVVRIWPAYVVVVIVVLTLLPEAKGADLTVWLANLTLTQVFVPLSLTAGLTQMWSLSVEVTFYALLPIIGFAMLRVPRRRRIPVLIALGVLSLGWAWLSATFPLPAGVEPKNWVFGHLPWFIAGLVLAEIAGAVELSGGGSDGGDPEGGDSEGDDSAERLGQHPRWLQIVVRLSARRGLMLIVLVVAYGLACTPLAGPTGLGDLASWQFAVKMILGAICGYAVLAPLICGDGPYRFLTSPLMLALGRWSYGIFIWHLAVLAVVFGLFGIVPFSGHMPLVWTMTVVVTIAVSAASYAFVEEPARRWLRRSEARSAHRREARSAYRSEARSAHRREARSAGITDDDTSVDTAISAGT